MSRLKEGTLLVRTRRIGNLEVVLAQLISQTIGEAPAVLSSERLPRAPVRRQLKLRPLASIEEAFHEISFRMAPEAGLRIAVVVEDETPSRNHNRDRGYDCDRLPTRPLRIAEGRGAARDIRAAHDIAGDAREKSDQPEHEGDACTMCPRLRAMPVPLQSERGESLHSRKRSAQPMMKPIRTPFSAHRHLT